MIPGVNDNPGQKFVVPGFGRIPESQASFQVLGLFVYVSSATGEEIRIPELSGRVVEVAH